MNTFLHRPPKSQRPVLVGGGGLERVNEGIEGGGGEMGWCVCVVEMGEWRWRAEKGKGGSGRCVWKLRGLLEVGR